MKSAFWRALAVAAIVAMPTLADANDATIGSEAAHSAMSGTTLNNTTAIFNAFPHLTVYNGTGAEIVSQRLTAGPGYAANGSGRARVWWEAYEDLWLNLQVGRGDLGGQVSQFFWGGGIAAPNSSVIPNGQGFTAFQNDAGASRPLSALNNPWIDLGIAVPVGDGGAFAGGILVAGNGATNKKAGTNSDKETADKASGYGVRASFGSGAGMHVSGEFTMQSQTDERVIADPNDPTAQIVQQIEGDFMNFGGAARFDTDMYIYQGSLVFGKGKAPDSSVSDADADFSGLGFMASAGRFLKNEVDGQTSIEFMASYFKTSQDDVWVDTSDNNTEKTAEGSTSNINLPGVRVATWEKITDRFGIMGGVGGAYAFSKSEKDDTLPGTGTNATETSGTSFSYGWSAGMFAQPTDNVRIDFQFVKENLGQILSLGNNTGLVAYIGATVGLN